LSARELVTDVLLVAGVALALVGCLGVISFGDAFDRLHYGAPVTLGAVLIAAAVVVKESFSMVGDKTILVAGFLLAAAPVVTHAVARAARTAQRGDWRIGADEAIEVEEENE
jgi:monovalent cation/proton antiporter MnhG/PhaG subunit